MVQDIKVDPPRTNADDVFKYLYREIVTLGLMPGAKMSEVEIANRFGISRQPVRDAFSRLGNMGFLNIRPKKATEVARFSRNAIDAARFVRMSLEVEVTRRCHALWSDGWRKRFSENLALQRQATQANDKLRFLDLDFEFHAMLCEVAEAPFVVGVLREKKVQVDRLCLLSLHGGTSMETLVADHEKIVMSLDGAAADDAVAAMLAHLHRLDRTVEDVWADHGDYFET